MEFYIFPLQWLPTTYFTIWAQELRSILPKHTVFGVTSDSLNILKWFGEKEKTWNWGHDVYEMNSRGKRKIILSYCSIFVIVEGFLCYGTAT